MHIPLRSTSGATPANLLTVSILFCFSDNALEANPGAGFPDAHAQFRAG